MLPYWLLFILFAIGAVTTMRYAYMPAYSTPAGPTPYPLVPSGTPSYGNAIAAASYSPAPSIDSASPNTKGLLLASLVPVILIGFRYDVGTDYRTYVEIFHRISHLSLSSAFRSVDVGYAALNWGVAQTGAQLWLVNLVCAILFTYGLVQFAKTQPNPWLAITIAVPYLVITVGMGLSRQAVAIGLGMAGLAALGKGSYLKFVIFALAGALFHRSAFILIPIIALAYSRNRLVAVGMALFGSVVGYYVLTSGGAFERLQDSYIKHPIFESQGAWVRLAMNIPPAALFLLFVKRFSPDPHERLIYAILSIISFISFVLLLVYPAASTPIDRMALYVIPLQIFVLSRLPSVFPDDQGYPSGPLTLAIVFYSAAVEFVWLNYATFAADWIPYQFVPFNLFG